MAWTVFEYLYRDADNHKAFGRVGFEGLATEAQWEAVLQIFDERTYFIAEQIGLPALSDQLFRWSGNAPTDADHCWHEFHSTSVVEGPHLPRSIYCAETAEAFVERVRRVKNWEVWLSPNPR